MTHVVEGHVRTHSKSHVARGYQCRHSCDRRAGVRSANRSAATPPARGTQSATATVVAPKTYTVKSGDTLGKIAKEHLG